MSVNNYLEAFLTIYGWEFYYMLYLLLASLGLFLYPVLRTFAGIYIDYLSDTRSNGDGYLTKMLAVGLLTTLVFVFALVPIVPVNLNQFKEKGVCGSNAVAMDEVNGRGKYFVDDKTSVPIFPWIAMMLGQGFNNVMYKLTPCAPDITEGQKAVWNANLGNNEELTLEFQRYNQECHLPITNRFQQIIDGKYTTKRDQENLEYRIKELGGTDAQSRNKLLHGLDSELIKYYAYKNTTGVTSDGLPIWKLFKAKEPVPNYTGDPGDGSADPASPPYCRDWWMGQGSTPGLRVRLADALADDVVQRVASAQYGWFGVKKYIMCHPIPGKGDYIKDKDGNMIYTEKFMKGCREQIQEVLYKGKDDKLITELLDFNLGNYAKDEVLTTKDQNNLKNAIQVTIASIFLAKFTDVDLAGGVLNTVVGFYATFYMLSLMLKFLLPLILMTIYMFWGVFMTIARLTMDGVIKGMVLISGLIIMPGIWGVMSHLDDKIWEAMYGEAASKMSFDLVLLDAAFSAFKVAAVFVLFYLINLGEGVNPGQVMSNSDSSAKALSSGLGGAAGSAAGGTARRVQSGVGKSLRRIGNGIKSGFRRLWRH